MRQYYGIWMKNGKQTNPENHHYQNRIKSRKEFRRQVRIEQARTRDQEKQKIMETRTRDSKLFHQLVRNNRQKGCNITDLHVENKCYNGDQVIDGFKSHFSKLATPMDTSDHGDQITKTLNMKSN